MCYHTIPYKTSHCWLTFLGTMQSVYLAFPLGVKFRMYGIQIHITLNVLELLLGCVMSVSVCVCMCVCVCVCVCDYNLKPLK